MLLDNHIKFSLDGDVDMLDQNGLVIATSGMIQTEVKVAIDAVGSDSKLVHEAAGYKCISSPKNNMNTLK